jgi:transglutaminase-like putative cysteine protease
MHFYSIHHLTTFNYSDPITESVMEVRMQPLSRNGQRCLSFQLRLSPKAKSQSYKDFWGNMIHTFDVPGRHEKLSIGAEASVSVQAQEYLPRQLEMSAWDDLDALASDPDFYDWLAPSQFARPSAALYALQEELGVARTQDPLTLLRTLNSQIYNTFAYTPNVTEVDSPIEDSLETRQGVCQDFVHVTLTLLREVGIPCRYVSGYLYHERKSHDRSAADATHAWIPGAEWISLDPTNNLMNTERHIKVALGRDYADVPPTRGVFKGDASSTLEVAVRVNQSMQPPTEEEMRPILELPNHPYHTSVSQQQQQQQ